MNTRTRTLFRTPWLSLRVISGDGWSYTYSHEDRCGGRVIAVLPFRGTDPREYLIRSEVTPCWSPGAQHSALTGGWEGGDPAADAVREVAEESGYAITAGNLIPLGECFASKSSDTRFSLYAVDITGMTPAEAEGDGSPLEAVSTYEWADETALLASGDAQLTVTYVRLLRHLAGLTRGTEGL